MWSVFNQYFNAENIDLSNGLIAGAASENVANSIRDQHICGVYAHRFTLIFTRPNNLNQAYFNSLCRYMY